MRHPFVALTVCALFAACTRFAPLANAQGTATAPTSQRSSRPVIAVANPSAKDAAVLEAALRDSLSRATADETTFVSLGMHTSPWNDPPDEFLKRFDDLKLKLRPVSAARHPEPFEKESPNRYRGIEDPETGRRSSVHSAKVKEWVSENKVRVEVGVTSGPLSGSGGTDIYELRDGKWVWTRRERGWVS